MGQLFLAYMESRDIGMEPLLLTVLMLYNNGFDVCRYVSMDEHIALTRSEYYAALAQS